LNIVWFKRDLRIEDHDVLTRAIENGKVIPLYILEPDLWHQPDMSYRHYIFLQECLNDLNQSLTALGQKLIIKIGSAVDVLDDLHKRHSIDSLWSHQETWNGWTFKRDRAVKNWCNLKDINWHEIPQNGVIRCLKNRDGWAAKWHAAMNKPIAKKPNILIKIDEDSDELLTYQELGLKNDDHLDLQIGDREEGLKLLESFLYQRGENYSKKMSSPATAYDSCSRLSPHLAFGTLSLREVYQSCKERSLEIKNLPRGKKGKWSSAMRSFSGRLRWHCHFIQKLEDEPRIEFQNMHSAYNSLRQSSFNSSFFDAWKSGMTGFPMVDACMRSLKETGWLNFRMRAMIMSFASYHLWLHWRKPALYLANLFVDYEPGIHYCQAQMQSGTTGINAIRIYNPIKQGIDHDPKGVFIRRWIPELRDMDETYIHMPWQAQSQMNNYPIPIIDEKEARKFAADQLYSLRKKNNFHKIEARKIFDKHGSRKSRFKKIKHKKPIIKDLQKELPL
tara:strand:- start:1256 stop:2764 length:1509 start_codon:yes stop_codon:yes gene_type:complete